MKHLATTVGVDLRFLVVLCTSIAPTATLAAQAVAVGIGGGALIPAGDYGANDKVGWHVLGMAEVRPSTLPVSVRVDAMYSRTAHQGGVGGDSKLNGVMGDLVWQPRLPGVLGRLYLLGGVGLYHVSVDVTGFSSASATKVAFSAGVGVLAATRGTRIFWEARFTSVGTGGSATSFVFIPISAGVSFGLK